MSTRTKPTNLTLTPDVVAALDRLAGLLKPDKPNRTDAAARCIRLVARIVERDGIDVLYSKEADKPIPTQDAPSDT